MSIFDEFVSEVDRGRVGINMGLDTGIPALNEHIGGVQRSSYVLIGGSTGTGKTALVDKAFVISPYRDIIACRKKPIEERNVTENAIANTKLKIFYFSFEISRVKKISKWVCMKLFNDEGIIISPKEVFGKSGKLDDEIYEKIKKLKEYYEEMFKVIELRDMRMHPTGIFSIVKSYCEKLGSWETIKVKDPHTHEIIESMIFKYSKNNDTFWPIVIVDHVGLIRSEQNKKTGEHLINKKQRIDKLSEYGISLRDDFGATIVYVSQFNRELGDINRQRFQELRVQLEDFKDTGNSQEDCNIALGLFTPVRYNMTTYRNYNIRATGNKFRAVDIIKNRDGEDNISFGCAFMGENGNFTQVPPSEDFQKDSSLYKQYFKY